MQHARDDQRSLAMKLLFVTSSRVGDAVLSTGLLDHLIRELGGPRVTIACGAAAASLFAATPGLDRVIPLVKRRFIGHWLGLWLNIVGHRWDVVIDLRASALAYTILARRRHVWQRSDRIEAKVTQLGRFLNLDPPPNPVLWLDPHHRALGADLAGETGPILAVAPIANWIGKQWKIERFIATVERLTGAGGILPGARVAIFGAPHERVQAQPLFDALPDDRVLDMMRFSDLLTVAAVLDRSSLFVGNDSGLMHMAAALGRPTLGLFGPSDERFYRPWGEHTAIVRTDLGFDDLVALRREDDARNTPTLMDGLPVGRVVAAAEELWRGCKSHVKRIL